MTQETPDFPKWIIDLAKRLTPLTDGRYQLFLTIDKNGKDCDWTLVELGKVERSRR